MSKIINIFYRISLKLKILIVINVIYFLSIIVVSNYWFIDSYNISRQYFESRVDINTKMVAKSLSVALKFDDQDLIVKIINTLGIESTSIRARLLDKNGVVINEVEFQEPNKNHIAYPLGILDFSDYTASHDVILDDQLVGKLILTASASQLKTYSIKSFLILSFFLFVSIIISTLIGLRVLGWLLRPIYHLSLLAKKVSLSNNYSLRSKVFYDDDVGDLATEFNRMLNKVENRDLLMEYKVAEQTKELSWQATHDQLTGLLNRRGLQQVINDLISSEKILGQYALLMLDLDQFKLVNDTCGHNAGDELLQKIADELRNNLRSDDYIARLGGDEFAIVLRCDNEDKMLQLAEIVKNCISDLRVPWESVILNCGTSVGAILIEKLDDNGSLDSLIKSADSACYAAKDKGRDRVFVFRKNDVELNKRNKDMQYVGYIQQAIKEGKGLSLYSQKVFALVDEYKGKEYHEILIRFELENPDESIVLSPDEFLPAVRRYGVSSRLDRWVVSNTLSCLLNNKSDFGAGVWINLASTSISDQEFVGYLFDVLSSDLCPAEKITFEITEASQIEDLPLAAKNMRNLKDLGCRFALDDFGSGASSLQYLKELPFDILKVDGDFILNTVTNTNDFLMTQSLVQFAKAMGMITVAEKVENQAVLDKVKELGFDYGQGWGLSHPEKVKL